MLFIRGSKLYYTAKGVLQCAGIFTADYDIFCEKEKKQGNRLEGVAVGLGVSSHRVGIVL